MVGQISIFDIMDSDPIRTPCNRRCEYEWCSIGCFEKRGQMYNFSEHKWVRDENGKILIGKRSCDWEPKEEKSMKEICKNCGGCRPTYKGGICEKTGKKTKLTGTCEDWRPKK